MRKLLFFLVAFPLFAVQTYTICASGCTHDLSGFQTALTDAATYQDSTLCETVIIMQETGTVVSGNFLFPTKTCKKYIIHRTSLYAELTPGQRITSSDTAKLAMIRTPNASPAINIPSDGYWRFEGIEITKAASGGTISSGLIVLGVDTEKQISTIPHHIQFHKVYAHGPVATPEITRGFSMVASNVEILDSSLTDFVLAGSDTQAIWCRICMNLVVTNSLISAGTENFMAGGGASIEPLGTHSPSGMVFRGNHFWKDPTWKRSTSSGPCAAAGTLVGELCRDTVADQWYQLTALPSTWNTASAPAYTGTISEKNIFELKVGRRVRVFGNVLENSWLQGQGGPYLIINQQVQGHAAYSVEDVVFAYNRVISPSQGVNYGNPGLAAWNAAHPDSPSVTRAARQRIEHNLITSLTFPGSHWRVLSLHRNDGLTYRHNTVSGTSYLNIVNNFTTPDYTIAGAITITDNIWPSATGFWGLDGRGSGWCGFQYYHLEQGNGSLDFRANAGVGTTAPSTTCTGIGATGTNLYTGTNPANEAAIYTDPASDWTVKSGSPALAAGVDGRDLGTDIAMVNGATSTVISGTLSNWNYFQIRDIRPTSTGATVFYSAPTSSACTTTVSVSETFSSTTGTIGSTTAVGLSRQLAITDLTAKTPYWLRVVCGSYQYRVPFMTWI